MKRLIKKSNNTSENDIYESFNLILSDVCNKIPELKDEELDAIYEEKRYEYDNGKDALDATLYEVEDFLTDYMYDEVDDDETYVNILKETITKIKELQSQLNGVVSISEKESKFNEICTRLVEHTKDTSWLKIYSNNVNNADNLDEALENAKEELSQKCNAIINQLGNDENASFYKEQLELLKEI